MKANILTRELTSNQTHNSLLVTPTQGEMLTLLTKVYGGDDSPLLISIDFLDVPEATQPDNNVQS